MKDNNNIAQKIEELDKNTEWFYSDEFNLDEAAEKYEAAIALAKGLQKDLDELQNKVKVLSENFGK